MDRMKTFISPVILAMILTLTGCVDENFRTSHPEQGGVVLTMNWDGGAETALPPVYNACFISPSGKTQDFDRLSGETNNFIVEPGDVTLCVYNPAESIFVFGTKAIVNRAGSRIAANPGQFFSYSGQIHAKQDRDTPHTAQMLRRTGDLKLSIAIKPESAIDWIRAVYAELDGVASELDMQTNTVSTPSSVHLTFAKNSFYAVATSRLLGFVASTGQNLKLSIEFENGYTANVTRDLSSLVKDFSASKSGLFTLNATMEVADGDVPSVTVDRWECNTESRYLSASASEVKLTEEPSAETVLVTTDQTSWGYSIVNAGNWLTVEKTNDRLNVSAAENSGSEPRQARINISAGGLSESITVVQSGYVPKVYSDREVVKLQSATVGRGVNLVMMGDGYTARDMVRGSGKYEQDMRTATEHFFSVYPYTVYQDHFNVYMVAAVSNEEGISVESTGTTVDTKFSCRWEGSGSTRVDCDYNLIAEYVDEISELETVSIHDIAVIMPINANIYAGTCWMFYGTANLDLGNGFSISLCPVGRSFKEVVVHESGGHGFAKLMDEYVYYWNETIPDTYQNSLITGKTSRGWYENVDFYDDILRTTWRGFANNPKYSMVGTFEGAYMYGKGIWRPEYNSCMNNNVLYFNAPSRWAQVKRIKRLAGFDYSFEEFLRDDIVPEYPSTVRSGGDDKEFIPLAPPVIREMNVSVRK
jgi:hypothetical protein